MIRPTSAGTPLVKILRCSRWLPAYAVQRMIRRPYQRGAHLMITLADHFEPSILPEALGQFADLNTQERRLETWCRAYPQIANEPRDSDGYPFRHTYFYPAEQAAIPLIERLAAHCRAGWGETEIHLHHGVTAPDTAENTRRVLLDFRDMLAAHGCLSQWEGKGPARYAFVHGNWALANSAGGYGCGVDEEMAILAETGCFADFTLPSAPHPAQIAKINALYECTLPFHQKAPHRRGRNLRRGRAPQRFPLIVQGPLALDFSRSGRRGVPLIENGEITARHPATPARLRLWRRAAITVGGRPDWVFIKLHCHGMDPRDREAMLGEPMRRCLRELTEDARERGDYHLHFVSAREMVNIILAACDGRDGNPGDYRDYRLKLIAAKTCKSTTEPIGMLSHAYAAEELPRPGSPCCTTTENLA